MAAGFLVGANFAYYSGRPYNRYATQVLVHTEGQDFVQTLTRDGLTYSYRYTVVPADPEGPGALEITAVDLVGNPSTMACPGCATRGVTPAGDSTRSSVVAMVTGSASSTGVPPQRAL